jgi:hypothetical protein
MGRPPVTFSHGEGETRGGDGGGGAAVTSEGSTAVAAGWLGESASISIALLGRHKEFVILFILCINKIKF